MPRETGCGTSECSAVFERLGFSRAVQSLTFLIPTRTAAHCAATSQPVSAAEGMAKNLHFRDFFRKL
jgi:hypothetical protein